MLFIVTWKIPYEARTETLERFRKFGGMEPKGVELIARYHYADGSGGISIAEATDAMALYQWCQEWSDVLVMDTRPVLSDDQVTKALGWDA